MLVLSVVGARPNFMKIAPVHHALAELGFRQLLVHTGQHYDDNMSRVFLEQLGMPEPDLHLGVGSESHARQTARIMVLFEEICREHGPDMIVAGGDVNSTVAAALVAAKEQIPLAHVEAGLRSFDRTMPEEVNRVVTDHLSSLLFTTEESANRNLAAEGIASEKVSFVGNCMVDSLLTHEAAAREAKPWRRFGFGIKEYSLLTLHRPANVDDTGPLRAILGVIAQVATKLPVLFPVHPRTRARLVDLEIDLGENLHLVEPLPYLDFLGLMTEARCVLTDSGGIQEETTTLDVPCLTLRPNTERPITVELGSNLLVGDDPELILSKVERILSGDWKRATRPPLWDGRAGQRVAEQIELWLSSPR